MSIEAKGFNIQDGIQALRQVGSQKRPDIYAQFVGNAATSPIAYIDSTTQLQQIAASGDISNAEYAQKALKKILERVKPARFTSADLTAAYPQLLDLLATNNKELADQMIHTLLNKPGERLVHDGFTEEDVWNSAQEAIEVMEAVALTTYKSKNRDAVANMIDVWRANVLHRDPSRVNIVDILTVANEFGSPQMSARAFAAKSLMTAIEICEKGPVKKSHPQARQEAINALERMIYKIKKAQNQIKRSALENNLDSMEQRIGDIKEGKFPGETYIHGVELTGDEITDAAYLLHFQNTVRMIRRGTIQNDMPKHAKYIQLPGRKLAIIIPTVKEVDTSLLRRAAVRARIKQMDSIPKKEDEPVVTAEELNTICHYGLPQLDREYLDYYNEEKKAEAMAGIYGLSNRGDKVIIHDPLPAAAGIKDIVFKNFSSNTGSNGRTTLADINVLGTTFRCILDEEYNLHFPDGIDQQSQKVLQSIVYTYLAELRSGRHELQDNQTDDETVSPTTTSAVKNFAGRRPHLRILPNRHRAIASENPVVNSQSSNVFGHSISKINFYYSLAVKEGKIAQSLPKSLQLIIQTLLKRTEKDFEGLREITFVNDASTVEQPPKEIKLSVSDLDSILASI